MASWGAPASGNWPSSAVKREDSQTEQVPQTQPQNAHSPRHQQSFQNTPSERHQQSFQNTPSPRHQQSFQNTPSPRHQQSFGGTPRFQHRQWSPSPRHFQPRPRFQSSPLVTQGYSPNHPGAHEPNSPQSPGARSQSFPSGGHMSAGRDNSFHFQRKPFMNRDRSMNNPGGSDNICDYIHPSMLDDPWRNLPATPMVQQY